MNAFLCVDWVVFNPTCLIVAFAGGHYRLFAPIDGIRSSPDPLVNACFHKKDRK